MTLRALPALLASALVLSVCAEAAAQTSGAATLNGNPKRREGRLPSGIATNVINYADCLADEKIRVTLGLLANSLSLEVWAGFKPECADPGRPASIGVPDQCWQVYQSPTWPMGEFTIAVRDILPHDASGVGTGTGDVCDKLANTGNGSGNLTIYFVPVSGIMQAGGGAANYAMKFDLQGPPPPTDFSVGLGESRLIPMWSAGSRSDVSSYKLYCQPSDSCESTYLFPDAIPGADIPDDVKTNTAGQNATEGEVSGLTNDQNYACAIAALDSYGNLGKLSELACGAPKPVNGYYKSYRAAGGTAGGGFCSFGREVNSAAPPLVLAAVGALAARRRRRRSAV